MLYFRGADWIFGKKNKKKAIFIRIIIWFWASVLTKQSKIRFFYAKLVIGFVKFHYAQRVFYICFKTQLKLLNRAFRFAVSKTLNLTSCRDIAASQNPSPSLQCCALLHGRAFALRTHPCRSDVHIPVHVRRLSRT